MPRTTDTHLSGTKKSKENLKQRIQDPLTDVSGRKLPASPYQMTNPKISMGGWTTIGLRQSGTSSSGTSPSTGTYMMLSDLGGHMAKTQATTSISGIEAAVRPLPLKKMTPSRPNLVEASSMPRNGREKTSIRPPKKAT